MFSRLLLGSAIAMIVMCMLLLVDTFALANKLLHRTTPKCRFPQCKSSELRQMVKEFNPLIGQHPWFTAIPLSFPSKGPCTRGAPRGVETDQCITIEAFFSPTCDDCAHTYTTIFKPLSIKYGDRVQFSVSGFPLVYQPHSYDCLNALYSVYRLTGNSSAAFFKMLETIFVPSNQGLFFDDYMVTRQYVWHNWLGAWALPLITPYGKGIEDFIGAMNGTITDANYRAWFDARRNRQFNWNGAPSFIVNSWNDQAVSSDSFQSWSLEQWSQWIEDNLRD